MKKGHHDIDTLNLRAARESKKKMEIYRELKFDYENGKITEMYFWEKAKKLFNDKVKK